MDSTPGDKRVVPATPQKSQRLSLLASFGALSSPTSVSKMRKQESTSQGNMPGSETPASGASFLPSPSPAQQSDSVYDLEDSSSEDVITVSNPATPTRQLPPRSARQTMSYARPPRNLKKSTPSALDATAFGTAHATRQLKATGKTATARVQIRQDIANYTKPKRDAFFLAKKDFFLPLLPSKNYISKMEAERALHDERDRNGHPEMIPSQEPVPQPEGITATLKPYQREGLTFLVHMNQNGMSAILGDEMGLGKTLQTLSLFQHLTLTEPNTSTEPRPFLVICPLSVLSSWVNEATKWTPGFKVIRFHGPKVERERMKQEIMGVIDRYGVKTGKQSGKRKTKATDVIDLTDDVQPVDIVITTYEAFVKDQGWFKRAFVWRYVVADEGHKLKNAKSDVARALQSITAEHRLLLTGTPLQNNLEELWALLHWLFPQVFTEDTSMNFKQAFNLTQGKASTSFMDNARRLLELIMLRRMKHSPGVDLGLPAKEEILLYVPLTPMQRFWYTRLLTKADNLLLEDLFRDSRNKVQAEIKEEQMNDLMPFQSSAEAPGDVWTESRELMSTIMRSDTPHKNEYQKLMALVIQLRKTCSHPYLLPGALPEPYFIGNHIRIAAGKFIVLEKLLQELVVKQGKKLLIFSGWTKTLDMIEDLLAFMRTTTDPSAIRSLRFDGSTARARRNLLIRMFNDEQSEFKIMLISTRAGGLGINLTSATNVVFMDEDWNPQVTLQAEARAHRIGQTKPVTIYKLCSQGTVEEQMLGRIRKKLYLSAKITESMRNMHNAEQTPKRKRDNDKTEEDDNQPTLDTSELKTLLRRGAQTLSAPELDVDEMLNWDWQTTVEKCRDRPQDPSVAEGSTVRTEIDEEAWLNNIEKVETAIFEGKRHHRQLEQNANIATELNRADRRIDKNTTVMVDGFAISKESMGCADWEAVPTLAGKDARLAEPVKAKKDPIQSQEHCQVCFDGGELFSCPGCPRAYHANCVQPEMRAKAEAAFGNFRCPQHECFDCQKKTEAAGGLIFRCRWCEKGYCEDCMDWDTVKLIGELLSEMKMLNYYPNNAWYIECQACVESWKQHPKDYDAVQKEKARIEKEYQGFLMATEATGDVAYDTSTPTTWSEAETPVDAAMPSAKKQKLGLLA